MLFWALTSGTQQAMQANKINLQFELEICLKNQRQKFDGMGGIKQIENPIV